MKFIIITAVLILCFIALCLFENKRELQTFQIVHHNIKSEKIKKDHSLSLIFISDLHNHQYGEDHADLLMEISKCKPDVILIGGDLIIRSDQTSYSKIFPLLNDLIKMAPVYFSNGNHEQKLKEFEDHYELSYQVFENYLQEKGICHLVNQTEMCRSDKNTLSITGLEIPVTAYRYLGNGKFSEADLKSCIGTNQDSDRFHILLAHNPMFMDVYKTFGADLILSGHLHGGIIRIPLLGGLIAPNFIPFPKYSGGVYEEKDCTIIVSNGLGTHSVPVRINCPAQLIHLTIYN